MLRPSALSAFARVMLSGTPILFVAPLPAAGQNPEPEKAQTENMRPLFYFITAGPSNLRPEQRVSPVYPPLARIAGLQGDVSLDVAVEADGSVSSVKPLSGDPLLAGAASDAVRRWRFARSPNLPARETIWVQFRLADTGPTVDDRKHLPDYWYRVSPPSSDYPVTAIRRGVEGQVVLEITEGSDGKISDLRVLKSDSGVLTSAAVDSMQNPSHLSLSRCTPSQRSPCIKRVVVNYELNPQDHSHDLTLPIAGIVIQAPTDLLMTHWDLAMYPHDAQKDDVEGDVRIKLTVDQNGEVSDAEIVSGPEPLQTAALGAAVRSRFAPPSAAPAGVTLNYHFWVPK